SDQPQQPQRSASPTRRDMLRALRRLSANADRGRLARPADLAKLEQDDHEDQRFVRGDDAARAAFAVGEMSRYHEATSSANAHADHAVVPALDDLTGAELEDEWFVPIPRCVELLAARGADADVVHDGLLARRGLSTVSD